MGAVDQPQRQKKSKGSGGVRRPKHRVGIRMDMTPMVDIAFLLLIFYMVTTIFSAPQSMDIVLPPKDSKEKKIDMKMSKMLTLMVDSDGHIFWQHSKTGIDMPLPQYVAFKDLRKFLLKENQETDGLVTVIMIDKDCRYERMVDIFDEIQVVERLFKQTNPAWSYKRSLQDMTNWEFDLMEKAKAAMGGIPKEAGGA